jgi:hypothetical protein
MMAEFNKGQTFLDTQATNICGTKGKYFIALTDADYEDDEIVCFYFNTEHRMDLYLPGCNSKKLRYIIQEGELQFIKCPSSVMLGFATIYKLEEICNCNSIKLLEIADELLCRKIKNCLDRNEIEGRFWKRIMECYK